MRERRKVSSEISASLVEYILRESKITQEQLAESLEVSAAFISRVRTRERSFTVDHLVTIETLLNAPLGAILLAAIPLPEPRPETKRLHELARQAIALADKASLTLASRKSHVSV